LVRRINITKDYFEESASVTQVTATSNEENMKVYVSLFPLFIFLLIFHIFFAGTSVFNDG